MGNAPNSKLSNGGSSSARSGTVIGKAPFHYTHRVAAANQRTLHHGARSAVVSYSAGHVPQSTHSVQHTIQKSPVYKVPVSPRTMHYLQQLPVEQRQQFLATKHQTMAVQQLAMTAQPQVMTVQHLGMTAQPQLMTVHPHPSYYQYGPHQQNTQAHYSVLMPGSEHLLSGAQQVPSEAVQHTAFSCTEQSDYLCISPAPLNEAGVISLALEGVPSYCAQRSRLPHSFSIVAAPVVQQQ